MFVTSTHNPVLFFSTAGKVYRLKVWKLPEGGPTTRGRPIVNLLPALDEGETIATVLPLPEDEAELGRAHVVFATAKGSVRRNSMDAFANIPSNGKFAMRFDEARDDRLIGVALLESGDDVLLASRKGKAIRFAGDDVREFVSRTSTGVRGMTLKGDDEVVSLSILHRVGTDQEEREEYLRFAPWKAKGRRALARARALRRAGREGAVHPHRLRQRLRQAVLGLRVPPDRPRRPGHHQHRQHRPQRPGRGQLPRHQGRPADAGDRPGQADPHQRSTSLRVIGRNSAGVRLFDVGAPEGRRADRRRGPGWKSSTRQLMDSFIPAPRPR
jgi:DNA gyrase subunit A